MAPRESKTRPAKTTSDKIIKAASRAFAEAGFQGASVRQIVARADVNQAAINYHFGSKEELYRAVLQKALHVLMQDDTSPGRTIRVRQRCGGSFASSSIRSSPAMNQAIICAFSAGKR